MIKIVIEKNDSGQRLDRFLKKYLENAPLSLIYKIIRKDVKVNGKRMTEKSMVYEGDEVALYMSQEDADKLSQKKKRYMPKKQFNIAYEDEHVLVVIKPFGLLTHGDAHEKKNTLTNQVCGYLQSKGEYDPAREKTFSPAAVNRLDRNTTGLVLFGKDSETLKELNQMIRERDKINKYYQTIVYGCLDHEVTLKDKMIKNSQTNTVKVLPLESQDGKVMETVVSPIIAGSRYTLVEVKILTGRTHQIRAHLARLGHPVIGDAKYGQSAVNRKMSQEYGLNTQLLHAYKLEFARCNNSLKYLEGKIITAELPENFRRIKEGIFGNDNK